MVSKPMKVVVVVNVVAVFVNKKMGPKYFWSKIKPCSQNFGPKSDVSENIWVKKKLGTEKFWSKKLGLIKS